MRTLAILLAVLLPLGALAGCVDAPVDPAAADDAALDGGATAAESLTTTPLSHDGVTPTGAAVCSPVTPCQGQYAAGGESSFELKFSGALDAVDIVATWDAASPASADLGLGLAIERDGEWTWDIEYGSSPLALQREGLDIPAGSTVYVYVNAHKCSPTPVAPCVSPEQAFHLEGTYGALPTA